MTYCTKFFLRLALLAGIAYAPAALAVTCTGSGGGAWNVTGTWTGCTGGNGTPANTPGTNDDVIFTNTNKTYNVPANAAAKSITFTGGNQATGLTVDAGFTLAVGAGGVTINAPTNNKTKSISLTAGATVLSVAGNVTLIGTSGNTAAIVLGTGTTATITGNLTANGAGEAITFVTTGTLNIGGNFTSGGVLVAGTGTVNYNGTGAQSIGTYTYNNLSVSKTSGTATLAGNTIVNANLSVNTSGGTLDLATFTANRATAGGTLTVVNGATLKIGGTNPFPTNYTAPHTLGATSTIEYSGTGQTVFNEGAPGYGHLTLSGSGIKTAAGAFTVRGNLTIATGVTLASTTFTQTVNGSVSNAGTQTATAAGGKITLNAGTAAHDLAGTGTYANLELNDATQGATLSASPTVNGTFTFTAGVLTTGANTLKVTSACTTPSVARTSGHVNGNLQLRFPTGAPSCVFHLGGATTAQYNPATIAFASVTVQGDLTGVTTAGDHPDTALGFSGVDDQKSVNRYWTLTNSGIVFTNYNATFQFLAGDFDGGAATASFVITKGDSCTSGVTNCIWTKTTAGTRTGTTTQATGITSGFSHFVVGEAGMDHFAINHGGTGINCEPSAVTITAHKANDTAWTRYKGAINVSTSTARGDWTTSASGTFTPGASNSGLASYTYIAADNGSVVLNLRDTYVETVNINVLGSGGFTEKVAEDPNLVFALAAFRFIDASDVATIAAQTAGTTSTTYFLQAIQSGGGTGVCGGAGNRFASGQSVTIDLASQCNDPTTCIAGQKVKINSTDVNSNPNTGVSSYTGVSLTFTTNSRASFTLNYPDAGKISLYARYDVPLGSGSGSGNLMTGTSNQFVVKPSTFVITSIPGNPGAADASGVVFRKAGQAFTVAVEARNSAGAATPNYGKEVSAEGVKITSNLVVGLGLTNNPTINNNTAFGSFSGGSATGTTFSWDEVGIITLTPSVGDGSYLGAGDVTGTASGNVGRFYPDNFNVTYNVPQFATACVAGTFTYVGQTFSYTTQPVMMVTARSSSAGNPTTQNYAGTWVKLSNSAGTSLNKTPYDTQGARYSAVTGTLNAGGLPATTVDPTISSFTNGVGTLTFSSGTGLAFNRTTPVASFNADISLSLKVEDTDAVAFAGNPAIFTSILFPNGPQMRFGRLTLLSARGSQLVNLQVPVEAQYWNGTSFITNAADNCTAIASADIAMGNYSGNLTATPLCKTAISGGGTLSSGRRTLRLAAPGAGNNGSVDLTANLGVSPAGNTCTTVGGAEVTATTANRPYLQGNWTGVNYDQNPSARARFGVYRGSDEIIDFRENFQ